MLRAYPNHLPTIETGPVAELKVVEAKDEILRYV